MRTMRRIVVRALLVLIASIAARDSLAFECRRRLLSDEEQRTLEAYVLQATGIAADRTSIRACRNWWVVELETVRAPQRDGTERRSFLQCNRMRKPWPEPWHCVEHPQQGFRTDTFPGELGVWIAMEGPMKLDDARRDVATGFELLAHDGEVPSCEGEPGKPRTFRSLRAEIIGGDGVVILSRAPDSFSLQVGYVIVSFARVAQGQARAECWSMEEIVVTS
jgi:hypothetical protein